MNQQPSQGLCLHPDPSVFLPFCSSSLVTWCPSWSIVAILQFGYIQLWGSKWHLLFPCFRSLGNLSNYATAKRGKGGSSTPRPPASIHLGHASQFFIPRLSAVFPQRASDEVCLSMLYFLLLSLSQLAFLGSRDTPVRWVRLWWGQSKTLYCPLLFSKDR